MINDFEKLLKSGELAFYEEAELTLLYLENVHTQECINYYSLFCFTELIKDQKENRIKRIQINDNYYFGVIQFRYSIKESEEIFHQIIRSEYNINNNKVRISDNIRRISKQFIPQFWENKNPIINKVLKPNYWGDSYILEFFDEEKNFNSLLSRDNVKKINKILNKIEDLSIDLSKVSDRIGNLIFQFPITILRIDPIVYDEGKNVAIKVLKHPKLKKNINLKVVFKASVDECITDFKNFNTSLNGQSNKIEFNDYNNVECYVSNSRNSLIYHSSKVYLLYSFSNNVTISMGTQSSNPRIIYKPENINPINYSVYNEKSQKSNTKLSYLFHIDKRVEDNQILSGDNKNYLICRHGDEEKALSFIRKKINENIRYSKEICLWDPYLSAVDIVNTIYYANEFVNCRCITDMKNLKDNDSILVNKKEYQKKLFMEYSNNKGVKLEFRCSPKEREDSFHDRFLIFSPKENYKLPIVYSLGTSINGIGKKHHLIQKVINPTVIYKAFNDLWDDLNSVEYILMKIPEELECEDD